MSRLATMLRRQQVGVLTLAVARADDLEEPGYGR